MEIERLIECVRSHTFLYDLSHKDYKNITLKAAIWESIGRELNQSGEAVRNIWKTIRDGYTKHKKQVKGTTGSGRKNSNYTWASQLAFLDNFNSPRASSSNVSLPNSVEDTSLPSPTQARDFSEDHQSSSSPSNPIQRTSTPPPSQVSSPEVPANVQYTASPSTARTVSSRQAVRTSGIRRDDDDVGRVIHFLNTKKRREYDGIDYLFLSYADTFKKFPPREQALMKLELAKLFSNTELRLLSQPVASPAYSNVSSDNTALYSPQPMNLSDNSNQPAELQNLLNQYDNSNLPAELQNRDNTNDSYFGNDSMHFHQ